MKGMTKALGRLGLEDIFVQGVTSCSRLEQNTALGRTQQPRWCFLSENTFWTCVPAHSSELSPLWCVDYRSWGFWTWHGGIRMESSAPDKWCSSGSFLLQLLGKSLLWADFRCFSFLVQKDKDMSRSLIPVYVYPSRSATLLPLQVWDHCLVRELSVADDKSRASVIISDGAVFTPRKRISAFPTLVNAEELSLQIRKKLTRALSWMNLSVVLPPS